MQPKWSLEELEETLKAGRSFGNERIVADHVDVFGDVGEVATLYYHLERAGTVCDPADYDFTFDNSLSLDENFGLLRESVQEFRGLSDRPLSTAASR